MHNKNYRQELSKISRNRLFNPLRDSVADLLHIRKGMNFSQAILNVAMTLHGYEAFLVAAFCKHNKRDEISSILGEVIVRNLLDYQYKSN